MSWYDGDDDTLSARDVAFFVKQSRISNNLDLDYMCAFDSDLNPQNKSVKM